VYDPGPSNISISPTSFTVGTATSFTISGNNLGTNCPTLTFPFAASYSLSSCQDQQVTGTLTANAEGSGDFSLTSGGFGGQAFLLSPGQTPTATSGANVSATGATCPSTVSLVSVTPLLLQSGLSNNFPTYRTGFGTYVILQVSDPSQKNWAGATITENVTPTSNNCPAQTIACDTGGNTFTVGQSPQTLVLFGTGVADIPGTNGLFDMHTTNSSYDAMAGLAQGATCQVVCRQTYSCGNTQLKGPSGPGVFSVTRSATHTTIGTTTVTVVSGSVTEQ
jgi:hypothetical protein